MPDDRRSLDQPMRRRTGIRPNVDSERFGALSESVARHIGSWAFILWMTIAILIWVALNTLVPESARIDGFPFIFLTLLLSLQASYAAPLILLAQNRQADRDRVQFSEDRARTERLLADSDYLAREIADLRLGLGDVATRDYVRGELRELLETLMERMDAIEKQVKDQRS
ncbi:MAG: DUF1003 domain-containing protein [Candidatus Nanopelagicales bacterium]|jgi:uncharacterized membrane protein|nr:DUF1003 domain-containing protein [Candidatus Nanopelagicales bacterium]